MIIVVEGVSAAGKTAWASKHASAVVDEITGHPGDETDVASAGKYWSDKHSERWRDALELERTHEMVCFDTDPLKIHYPWCLWQVGQSSREAWLANASASREHIVNKQLGFADQILLLEPSEDVVRQQKVNDATRRRSNFETNLGLREPLRRWYMLLEALSPGRVVFKGHETKGSIPIHLRTDRYSIELFDALISVADHLPQSH